MMSDDPILTAIGRIERRLDDLEAKLESMRAAVLARIDRLQGAPKETREGADARLTAASPTRAGERANSDEIFRLNTMITELAGMVLLLQRQIMGIQSRLNERKEGE